MIISDAVRLVGADILRTVRAFRTLFRISRDTAWSERLAPSLSLVKAESFSVRKGDARPYTVELSNPTNVPVLLRLLIEFRSDDPPGNSPGNGSAHATKEVITGSGKTEIKFEYDWAGRGSFIIGGVRVQPDESDLDWNPGPGIYTMRFSISTSDGMLLEELQLTQELSA